MFNLKVKNTRNVILFLKYQHSFLVMLQSYILFSCTKTVADGYLRVETTIIIYHSSCFLNSGVNVDPSQLIVMLSGPGPVLLVMSSPQGPVL